MSRRPASSRRYRQEEEFVRKRNAEQERAELWNGVDAYFRSWGVNTVKVNTWTSPEYYDANEESRAKAKEAEEKRDRLEGRRRRLAALLMADTLKYEEELRQMDPRKSARAQKEEAEKTEHLIAFTHELKRREEEKRSKEAELKLYHQWRTQEPVLRDHQRTLHKQFVRDAWVDQVKERHRAMDEQEQKEKERQQEMALQRELEEMREAIATEERKKWEADLQEQLVQQILQLREKEAAAEMLKAEEARDVRRQAEVDDILEQRRMAEKQRKNLEHGCFLSRQYQLRLRRRVRQVQEELASDLRCLARALECAGAEQTASAERLAKQRTDLENMNAFLLKQALVEKERERNAEFVFHEEARKMLEKQEVQWKTEKESRDKLMTEVLTELRHQLEDKLEENLRQQREVLKEREEILDQVEAGNADLKREQMDAERKKEERRKEIVSEMEERKGRELEEVRRREVERREMVENERRKEEMLLEELRKMSAIGYKPEIQGRRRILW